MTERSQWTEYKMNKQIYKQRTADPSAAAASRRAEFLGMRRAAAEFFYGSAES